MGFQVPNIAPVRGMVLLLRCFGSTEKLDWPVLNASIQLPSRLVLFIFNADHSFSNAVCGFCPRWTCEIYLLDMRNAPSCVSGERQAENNLSFILSASHFVPPQITQLDPGSTLLEAKLFPQETLFLEAKE